MKRFVTLLILLSGLNLFADDGMWLPHQIADLNLQVQGMELEPTDLFRTDGTGLMNAIVRLGGATGGFVSKDGLILTNHHVAYGAIQRASNTDNDYLKNGFIAKDFSDEIQAFGQTASVLLGYEDVTEQVTSVLKEGMRPRERYDALDKIKKELVKIAEMAPDIRAEVKDVYCGNAYYLFRYKRLQDIRIVFAPPDDLGRFGGDIDNWMWPRHTCDFTFLRAYVSTDGNGDPYSPENVPYQPKSFLKISLDGVTDGDFSFVMGYPGRTYRNDTVKEIENSITAMQERLDSFGDIMAFFEKASEASREVEIKYAGKLRGLANAHKNYTGKLEGFERVGLLDKKRALEDEFFNWAASVTSENYRQAFNDYSTFLDSYEQFQREKRRLEHVVSSYTGPVLMSQAHTIYRTVSEREKPDDERQAGYQDRDFDDIKQRILLADRSFDVETDKAYFKFMLIMMFENDPAMIPEILKDVAATRSEEKVTAFVNDLYARTMLHSGVKRAELLELNLQKLAALDDPFIDLAARVEAQLSDVREKEKALNQQKTDLKKNVLRGYLDFTDGQLAPDANSTLRLTFGEIAGYSPKDAVDYRSITTLTGVMEKETGEKPFVVPDKIKSLYAEKDFGQYVDSEINDVVTCFLNRSNVTGGSSGSPTLNAKGEQIGIIFDMTYESVVGDYYVIPEFQRTISVDIRYVLFVVEKFAGAAWLIDELGLSL